MKDYFKGVLAILLLSLFITANADEGSWKNLFNGKNFDNWVKRNGEAKYIIKDGVIVGVSKLNTANTFLCTRESYTDFILEMDVKVDDGLNSGIQIRSLSLPEHNSGRVHGYQVEIDPSERKWSGGIYDEGRHGWLYPLSVNAPGRDAFKPGAWNHYRIEAVGNTIRTWINGIQCANLVDNTTASGFIALQVHSIKRKEQEGLTVQWKNVRILTDDLDSHRWRQSPSVEEINYIPNHLTESQVRKGWSLLWDGTTTTGWRGANAENFPTKGWRIENGVLQVLASEKGSQEKGGDIVTTRQFSNFELELDYQITEGANSGIKYLVVEKLRPDPGTGVGLEYQILDDARHPDAKNGVNGNRTAGSLYDLITSENLSEPGKNKRINAPGKWNRIRIVVKGSQVEHWLNHIKVVAYDRESQAFRNLVAKSKFKPFENFGRAQEGHILLQDHGDRVLFRSVKIREF